MTTHIISSNDDIIDSRDVIARIEELEAEAREFWEFRNPDGDYDEDGDDSDWESECWQDASELMSLKMLQAEASRCEDWAYGAQLIRDSYFTEYAEQLADDIGAIDSNAEWPLNYINWELAAESLKQDYTAVEFEGVTYWLR